MHVLQPAIATFKIGKIYHLRFCAQNLSLPDSLMLIATIITIIAIIMMIMMIIIIIIIITITFFINAPVSQKGLPTAATNNN